MTKKFVKLKTVMPDGNYLTMWVDSFDIKQVSQLTNSQDAENKGTCLFHDGTTLELIAFNETIDSLN